MRACTFFWLLLCNSIARGQDQFETKKHHGYRSYYVLRNNEGSFNQPQVQQQRRPQQQQQQQQQTPRYGVWYPASSSGGSISRQGLPQSPQSGNNNGNLQYLPDTLQQLRSFKLVSLLAEAGLTDTLRYTIFAPTDQAVNDFLDNQSEETQDSLMNNPDAIKNLLLNHVVPGSLMSTDLQSGMKIKSLTGNDLDVIETSDGMTIGGAKLLEGGSNFAAINGYVHLIDDVIFPFKAPKGEFERKKPAKRLLGIDDDDPELIVTIDDGTIKGINIGPNHRAWLGIPYARPPTGDLRFAPPEPVDKWEDEGIKETRKQPNACQQTPDLTFGNFEGATMWNPNTEVSEDCLYLNVHTPRNRTSNSRKLPVLVWIYGGGFMTGSAVLDVYNPEQLVERGELVYVAMQYRVGAHGFLYFGQDSGAPGNVGLLDQVKALEWIQKNIAEFGGDPDDVTLMGESAGANSVALHMVSPLSCRLFSKAILQSTGLTPRWGFVTPEVAEERSKKLAEEVGCEVFERFIEDTVNCMREKASDEILAKEYNVDEYTVNLFPFVATIDSEFLLADPEILMREKAFASDKAVLIGSNANEGFWSLMYSHPDIFPKEELSLSDRELSRKEYLDAVKSIFAFYPSPVAMLIAHEYRQRSDTQERDASFKALDQMVGDSDFVCNTESFAQALSENGNDVFRYHYAHRSSQDAWPSWSGVKHGDELEFTFGHPLIDSKKYNGKEIGLAREILTYWTNFVKNGSPNPSSILTSWPKYSGPKWRYLNLTTDETTVEESGMADRCSFWNEVVPALINNLEDDESETNLRNVDLNVCK